MKSENTHVNACPHTHTHTQTHTHGCWQVGFSARRYLCSSAPWRAASPESPWAPALWTAPSSAPSSPAAPASPEPVRCQLPLWAGPVHTHEHTHRYTHTHEYIYTHTHTHTQSDVEEMWVQGKRGRCGLFKGMNDEVTANHSEGESQRFYCPRWWSRAGGRADRGYMVPFIFLYSHLYWSFYQWTCHCLSAAPQLAQGSGPWTFIRPVFCDNNF